MLHHTDPSHSPYSLPLAMGYPVQVHVSAQPKGSTRDCAGKAAASVQLTAVDFAVGENVEAVLRSRFSKDF